MISDVNKSAYYTDLNSPLPFTALKQTVSNPTFGYSYVNQSLSSAGQSQSRRIPENPLNMTHSEESKLKHNNVFGRKPWG